MGRALSVEERRRLAEIIVELPEFSKGTPRDAMLMMDIAGLGRLWEGLDLAGPPAVFASNLISTLEAYGYLADRPDYHALGALLSYLLRIDEIPPEDAVFIASLIVKYSLVKEPGYVRKLCDRYSLDDTEAGESVVVRVEMPSGPFAQIEGDLIAKLSDTICVSPDEIRITQVEQGSKRRLGILYNILVERYNTAELRELCSYLDIGYDDLPEQGKAGKARELVAYCVRRDRIADLLQAGRELRPDIPWEDIRSAG